MSALEIVGIALGVPFALTVVYHIVMAVGIHNKIDRGEW